MVSSKGFSVVLSSSRYLVGPFDIDDKCMYTMYFLQWILVITGKLALLPDLATTLCKMNFFKSKDVGGSTCMCTVSIHV